MGQSFCLELSPLLFPPIECTPTDPLRFTWKIFPPRRPLDLPSWEVRPLGQHSCRAIHISGGLWTCPAGKWGPLAGNPAVLFTYPLPHSMQDLMTSSVHLTSRRVDLPLYPFSPPGSDRSDTMSMLKKYLLNEWLWTEYISDSVSFCDFHIEMFINQGNHHCTIKKTKFS